MGKCKNIECNNETEGTKVYCSLTCRNIYVNKFLRNYDNNKIGLSKESIKQYELNPKYCKNPKCGEKIPYKNRLNNYCNHSCSASHINSTRNKKSINFSIEGLENIKNSNRNRVITQIKDYDLNPSICIHCGSILKYVHRNRKYCDKKCRKEFYLRNVSDILKYYKSQTKFNFSLNDYPDEFDFNLISKYGWYSPSNSRKPNIGGVSRDHMLSVMDGFKLNIDPLLLSHPANCKLMIHSDNIRKHKKSSITLDELLIRILEWDYKYGKYTK